MNKFVIKKLLYLLKFGGLFLLAALNNRLTYFHPRAGLLKPNSEDRYSCLFHETLFVVIALQDRGRGTLRSGGPEFFFLYIYNNLKKNYLSTCKKNFGNTHFFMSIKLNFAP